MTELNIRYDDTVHARDGVIPGSADPDLPLCGTSLIPACAPEQTSDPVDCWTCQAIIS